jgi:hypothetical protein
MTGSLLYLTVTRPDIQFVVFLCARFQASRKTSHRQTIKQIFRYIRYTTKLGLWYSASSSLSLLGFQMSTLRGVVSIGNRLWVLVSSWVPHWFVGHIANSQV